MSIELKIKLKSLAEEQRIIRKEELKHKGKWSFKAERLIAHRKFHIRPIIRATHVVYGLIKGKEYHEIEQVSYSQPDWKSIKTMAKKYGSKEDYEKACLWEGNNIVLKAA